MLSSLAVGRAIDGVLCWINGTEEEEEEEDVRVAGRHSCRI